jgi:hypothetical protein
MEVPGLPSLEPYLQTGLAVAGGERVVTPAWAASDWELVWATEEERQALSKAGFAKFLDKPKK